MSIFDENPFEHLPSGTTLISTGHQPCLPMGTKVQLHQHGRVICRQGIHTISNHTHRRGHCGLREQTQEELELEALLEDMAGP